ncbi:MAG: hypothetical protein QOD03_1610 [Verrucomicrobiota bacterium]|jgi:anti-sigma factor RsiW
MNTEQQLKLQAFLDGELPEREARDVAAWLAQDKDATALLMELRNTRQALGGFEPEIRLPETREFYWSKIQREIQRLEPATPKKEAVPFSFWFWRLLIPAGAAALLAIAGLFAFLKLNPSSNPGAEMATMLADANPVTYRDQAEGMTVVWLSYPAEKEFTANSSGGRLP